MKCAFLLAGALSLIDLSALSRTSGAPPGRSVIHAASLETPVSATVVRSGELEAISRDDDGPALGLLEINGGETPRRGHHYYQLQGITRYCVTETVRDVSSLPLTLRPFLKRLRSLSYADGFAQSMCWIAVRPDDSAEVECFRGTSPYEITGPEMNAPLQRLMGRIGTDAIKHVLNVQSHLTAQAYQSIFWAPARHLGPSTSELVKHVTMEQQYLKSFNVPLGSYLSIVFPIDDGERYDFYYTTHSFDPPDHTCPPQPGPETLP